LLEQIRTLDKRRLRNKVGKLKPEIMKKVNKALKIGLDLT
jgi:mRNA interferase MazF